MALYARKCFIGFSILFFSFGDAEAAAMCSQDTTIAKTSCAVSFLNPYREFTAPCKKISSHSPWTSGCEPPTWISSERRCWRPLVSIRNEVSKQLLLALHSTLALYNSILILYYSRLAPTPQAWLCTTHVWLPTPKAGLLQLEPGSLQFKSGPLQAIHGLLQLNPGPLYNLDIANNTPPSK